MQGALEETAIRGIFSYLTQASYKMNVRAASP